MKIPLDSIFFVSEKYSLLPLKVERIPHGLVNETFKLETALGEKYVLQRLNPIFNELTNEAVHSVTTFLKEKGFLAPSLVLTTDNQISVNFEQRIWRLFTYVEGVVLQKVNSPEIAASAGKILAKFHSLMHDFDPEALADRSQVNDFKQYFDHLGSVRFRLKNHRLFVDTQPLYRRLEYLVGALAPLDVGPNWIVHGDPKISNIMFSETAFEAICLLDFDTVARAPVLLELGDAMRSWCNPLGEDDPAAYFDRDFFQAALASYQGSIGDRYRLFSSQQILLATTQIFLELASRFLSDALEERYFGWDALTYRTRGEHNLVRAESQISGAESIMSLLN